eukprot:31497-Pelagococcus_subviridis.AAC.32
MPNRKIDQTRSNRNHIERRYDETRAHSSDYVPHRRTARLHQPRGNETKIFRIVTESKQDPGGIRADRVGPEFLTESSVNKVSFLL